jgi:hypothetical protein
MMQEDFEDEKQHINITPNHICFPSQDDHEQGSEECLSDEEAAKRKAIRKEKKEAKKKREAKRIKRDETEQKSKRGALRRLPVWTHSRRKLSQARKRAKQAAAKRR